MVRAALGCLLTLFALPAAVDAQTAAALTVVTTGPRGEVASLDEANEIRIVFSEPMVALGRIPPNMTAPFVRMAPTIPGAFRWSGTTILIFTPDPKRPLPFATTYEVTVDASATAVSGRKLAKPVTFRFTTPTVKLLNTSWYRRGGTVNGSLVLLLRFNQPVNRANIAAALTAALEPHDWSAPVFTPAALARLEAADPGSLGRFSAKVEATRAVAQSSAPVPLRLTTEWDTKRFPAASDLAVLETTAAVAPESHLKLTLAATVRSPAGAATPGRRQELTVVAEPAFFVDGFWCTEACDGDARNPIRSRSEVRMSDFASALTAVDITSATGAGRLQKTTPKREPEEGDTGYGGTIEDAGYTAQLPDRRYAVTIAPGLKSVDGQTLGYTWIGVAENWHMRAFTSFGEGQGVWEKDGGAQLPFYARNMVDVTQWAVPVRPPELMPLLARLQDQNFHQSPSGAGIVRTVGGTPDRLQSHGLDVAKALQPGGTGLLWASVKEGKPIPRSRRFTDEEVQRTKSTVVQVTNLGITVKDSPQNTLVFVTRLDNGAPVADARVSIVRTDNSTFWTGNTGPDGTTIAPNTRLRDPESWWKFDFIVTAEKAGDIAYVGSDWNEGISPWEFGTGVNLNESVPLLRGTVFTDRGVYKLGEELHLKAVLRHNAPDGIRLLPANTPVFITVRDSQNRIVEERTVRVTAWSSAEWTMTLPKNGALGNYSLRAILESDRPKPKTPEQLAPGVTPSPEDDTYAGWEKSVHGSFLVAAYRRPDFRVDVTLSGAALAGDPLTGTVTARYLFGAPMGPRPASWKFARSPGYA
ncbi:MAG: Ig-like domain-containing protein, partial [Acidobacteria bacterium]|nr:Ig-like domain-containing protein [Acidobacteriota bacterium]